jgi:hypothetical protein
MQRVRVESRLVAPAVEILTTPAATEGRILAVLIDSTVLGAETWFALDDNFKVELGDDRAIFYASELSFLRSKSEQTLREIHISKLAFNGGRVKQ